MRVPDKPIDWRKALRESHGEDFKSLISNENLIKKAIEFNRNYYYWSEIKYRTSNPAERKYVWTLMKILRSEKHENIPFKSLRLKYVIRPEINKYLHRFDKFLTGNIEIQTKSLGLQRRYVISSLMEEAIASSMLEGAATTRKVAKQMLKEKRKPKNKDQQMIVNGFETMQMIIKRKDEKLTPEFLLEIQATITKETLKNSSDVGRFRDNNNVVVADDNSDSIFHVPPDYKKINELINDLCDFANTDDDSEFIHPIIKGTILHFLIGYIHPFNDGNGRTARSVFYWYVLSRGYWLFEYMAVSRIILRSKKDYGLAYVYTEQDEMDLTYFLKYCMNCIDSSLNDLLEYIKGKQEEQKETHRILENLKFLSFRQASILEEMMNNPDKHYSIQEISSTYRTVYQTARADLLYLMNKGYLIMNKSGKKFLFRFNANSRDKIMTRNRDEHTNS
jgi:Fic family protein